MKEDSSIALPSGYRYKYVAQRCSGCNFATPKSIGAGLYVVGCDAPIRLKVELVGNITIFNFADETGTQADQLIYGHEPINARCHQNPPTNLCTIAIATRKAIPSNLGVVLPREQTSDFLDSRAIPQRSR